MKRLALTVAAFMALGISVGDACDTVALDTNVIWCYNIPQYRTQIQNALLNSNSGAAAQSIMQSYRLCQHGNALNLLNSCGPVDFLQSAHRVAKI